VLNAQEHLSDLVERLHDASPDIRAGAARGLSWMKATQCAPEIAALLSDHHDEVACAAIEALGRLNATQYIDQIGKLATDQSVSYQQNFVAMQVLVAFDAKEWAGEIAKLMEENDAPMVRGRAMLFVALLDGQEFAGMIAKYLDDYDVKEEAAMALGILGQTQYADKIAAHLRVNNYPSTRQAVVFSLIMMESAEYAGPATRAYREADMERNHLLGKAGAASERRLKKRFEASMKKLKEGRPSTEGP
jgi:HEAT repeat protein